MIVTFVMQVQAAKSGHGGRHQVDTYSLLTSYTFMLNLLYTWNGLDLMHHSMAIWCWVQTVQPH